MKTLLAESQSSTWRHKNSEIPPTFLAAQISGITHDSRHASENMLFVAVRGLQVDSHQFIDEVLGKSAWVIGEEKRNHPRYLQVSDSRKALGLLAAAYFGHPSRRLQVIGVTGTSGKTTTTYVLESILSAANIATGVIGTVSWRFKGKEEPATHTTPHPVALQSHLADFLARGCQAVVMEVSSHALKQHRVGGVLFDAMVFTNLSPEHLDYHPDMEDYFQSKKLLFTEMAAQSRAFSKKPVFVINEDDPYGQRLMTELGPSANIQQGFTVKQAQWQFLAEGLRAEIKGVQVESSLIGSFNASNLVAALLAAQGLGISNEKISQGISQLQAVPGRLERVHVFADRENYKKAPVVLVDYAHKPDALDKVIQVLRPLTAGRLITVVGCGGDRDPHKRPLMAKIAVSGSDAVYFTSDNPRTEDPLSILEMMLQGVDRQLEGKKFWVEADRRTAIEAALRSAQKGDIVLIAGKGHETYQILRDPKDPMRTIKIDFDDRLIAQSALRS